MPLSTYCYILGIVELLVGFPLLVFPRNTTAWFLQLKKEETPLRIIGALFFVLSVLVLMDDPSVEMDLVGLIRLLAWFVAIKSLITSWCPRWHVNISERLLSLPVMPYFIGGFAIAFGVLLLLAGARL